MGRNMKKSSILNSRNDGDDASGERQERQERQVAAVDRQRQLEQVNLSAAMRDA